jgi:hypothetical protein
MKTKTKKTPVENVPQNSAETGTRATMKNSITPLTTLAAAAAIEK